MPDLVDMVFGEIQAEIDALKRAHDNLRQQSERAEIADNVPAYTFAGLPTLAGGGLGDGLSYVTLAWVSNGRKSGEGAGAGTGVLAVYNAPTNTWLNVDGYVAITT